MNGIEFRSNWDIHLFEWISEHWDEINEDEWLLHNHILELIRLNVPPIQKSIFKHKINYRDNYKIVSITWDFLYEDNVWYKSWIDIPYQLDTNNAYKYDPREGF